MNFGMSAVSLAVILDITGQQKATPVMIKFCSGKSDGKGSGTNAYFLDIGKMHPILLLKTFTIKFSVQLLKLFDIEASQ